MPTAKQPQVEIDVLLRYCEEQWNHIRHLEDQRATFTNLVLVISVGVIGFIIQQGIGIAVVPLTIALIILGIYGAFASYKFYERYKLHKTHEELCKKKLTVFYQKQNSKNWLKKQLRNTKSDFVSRGKFTFTLYG